MSVFAFECIVSFRWVTGTDVNPICKPEQAITDGPSGSFETAVSLVDCKRVPGVLSSCPSASDNMQFACTAIEKATFWAALNLRLVN